MSTSVELLRPQQAWVPPAATPLNEAVWQQWLAKGRAQDRRSAAAWMQAVKWVSVAALVVAAGLWSNIGSFEVVLRFLVTAGALVVMFQAFQSRGYGLAALFGALALLYNPVAPAFHLSGNWQRAFVAASAIPFLASLSWPNSRNARAEHND